MSKSNSPTLSSNPMDFGIRERIVWKRNSEISKGLKLEPKLDSSNHSEETKTELQDIDCLLSDDHEWYSDFHSEFLLVCRKCGATAKDHVAQELFEDHEEKLKQLAREYLSGDWTKHR